MLPGVPTDDEAMWSERLHDPNPDLRGNIILLHDSGGDRSQTVSLLPILIDTLRAKGYNFVPVSELAGFTRDQVMPPLPLTMALYTDRVVFLTFSYVAQLLYYCFLGAIGLGVARLLVLAGLALWKRCVRTARAADAGCGRPATGHGADPGLQRRKSDRHHRRAHPGQRLSQRLEVLVIDDGSKDHTAYIVRSPLRHEKRRGRDLASPMAARPMR